MNRIKREWDRYPSRWGMYKAGIGLKPNFPDSVPEAKREMYYHFDASTGEFFGAVYLGHGPIPLPEGIERFIGWSCVVGRRNWSHNEKYYHVGWIPTSPDVHYAICVSDPNFHLIMDHLMTMEHGDTETSTSDDVLSIGSLHGAIEMDDPNSIYEVYKDVAGLSFDAWQSVTLDEFIAHLVLYHGENARVRKVE